MKEMRNANVEMKKCIPLIHPIRLLAVITYC